MNYCGSVINSPRYRLVLPSLFTLGYRKNNFTSNIKDGIPSKNVALLFPGQGTQYVGMGKDLVSSFKSAKETFLRVDERLKLNLSRKMFDGPEDMLQLTEHAQPAILAHSLAIFEILRNELSLDISNFRFVLGHSLGEFSALTAAEMFELEDAADTVRYRGRAMQECISPSDAGMAALIPVDLETATYIATKAREISGKVCEIANINSPSQIVISGHMDAIDSAISVAKLKGVKAKKLNVSAPFHCSIMQPAAEVVSGLLKNNAKIRDPKIPIISNVEAEAIYDKETVKELLVKQVTAPVRWSDCINYCDREGIKTFIEIGPGKVLSGLVRSTVGGVKCINVGTALEVKNFIKDFHVQFKAE